MEHVLIPFDVYLQKLKAGLPKCPDGSVNPLTVLPSHLHNTWRVAVAMTQIWAIDMDWKYPEKVGWGDDSAVELGRTWVAGAGE